MKTEIAELADTYEPGRRAQTVSNEDSNIYIIIRLCIVHVTHADITTCLLDRLYVLH